MNKTVVATFLLLTTLLLTAPDASGQHRSADESFTMALTGDSIINRKLSVYDEPEYLAMIELMRGADVAITNLETVLHDYEPWPMAESGGTWMRSDPFNMNAPCRRRKTAKAYSMSRKLSCRIRRSSMEYRQPPRLRCTSCSEIGQSGL